MEHSSYEGYVENLVTPRSPLLAEMETFAKEHHVPIMDLTGSEVLLSLLAMQRPSRILEVGTAIGYSAIRMAELLPDAEIVTIERNARRHEEALGFIGRSDVSDRITVIHGDAVELIGTIEGPFDAVFIDAAKGQYKKFFDGYGALVPIGGTIYSDNLFLRGDVLLEDVTILNRRRRRLVRLVKEFTEQLMARTDYHTAILPLGDGLAISRKLR